MNEQLKKKLEEDQKAIEELLSVLKKHAESLRAESQNMLSPTVSIMESRLKILWSNLEKIKQKQKRWQLWTGITCSVIALTSLFALWLLVQWNWSELTEVRRSLKRESDILSTMRAQSVEIVETKEGNYLILPKGTDIKKTYNCDNGTCLKFPEK